MYDSFLKENAIQEAREKVEEAAAAEAVEAAAAAIKAVYLQNIPMKFT